MLKCTRSVEKSTLNRRRRGVFDNEILNKGCKNLDYVASLQFPFHQYLRETVHLGSKRNFRIRRLGVLNSRIKRLAAYVFCSIAMYTPSYTSKNLVLWLVRAT